MKKIVLHDALFKLIALFVLVGMAQYSVVVLSTLLRGDVVLWTLDSELVSQAGFLRYIKDLFLVCFGAFWPLHISGRPMTQRCATIFRCYFLWVSCLLIVGILPFLLGYSPFFFLQAGVRWLILFHAAMGFFFMAVIYSTSVVEYRDRVIFYFLLVVTAFDLLVVLQQLSAVGVTYGLGVGESRLTGIFSNAGVAGFFGISIAMFALLLVDISSYRKLLLTTLCLFVALASGTRFAMMAVFLVMLLICYETMMSKRLIKWQGVLMTFSLPVALVGAYFLYDLMIETVGRGDILATQLQEGGRIANFIKYSGIVLTSDIGEFLVGRGLGVGTNTAYSIVENAGGFPEIYRFNWLVDNSLLTQFFQFGSIGSLIFWGGIILFLLTVFPVNSSFWLRRYVVVSLIFLVLILTSNPFEQYYLMLAFMFTYGVIYQRSSMGKGEYS